MLTHRRGMTANYEIFGFVPALKLFNKTLATEDIA
jgi:hypothetical protein